MDSRSVDVTLLIGAFSPIGRRIEGLEPLRIGLALLVPGDDDVSRTGRPSNRVLAIHGSGDGIVCNGKCEAAFFVEETVKAAISGDAHKPVICSARVFSPGPIALRDVIGLSGLDEKCGCLEEET